VLLQEVVKVDGTNMYRKGLKKFMGSKSVNKYG